MRIQNLDMYIVEVFIKWLNKRQTKEIKPEKPDFKEIDEATNCEHNFMPIDSTGDVLACTKCGFVIKKRPNFQGGKNF